MNKIKELFDFVDVLNKKSKYNILTDGEVISYNDEGYTWDGGSRPQSPYEIMADYLNEHVDVSIEGSTEWSKTKQAYVLHREYDWEAYGDDLEWDEEDPFEEMTLHAALGMSVPDDEKESK